jgi:hypothetical protein
MIAAIIFKSFKDMFGSQFLKKWFIKTQLLLNMSIYASTFRKLDFQFLRNQEAVIS